jgi:hypothetical protein
MSYIEFDPINPEPFENFVPKQEKRNSHIQLAIFGGLAVLVLFLVYKEYVNRKDDDFEVS